jgi:hypothetical protein
MRFRIPPNDGLLDWIADQADPPVRRIWSRRRVPVDALRCHPDLCDRLESSASGLPGVRLRYIVGLPVLLHANGVAFAIASGTTWIALRIPQIGQRAVIRSQWGRRGLDGEWVDVDPWITDLPAREGTSRLRGWTRAAHAHAGELWSRRSDRRAPSRRRPSTPPPSPRSHP